MKEQIQRAAEQDATILITGASGTGKELVATHVHYLSRRKYENFVSINAASIPQDLIESELFGFARGSFTGAVAPKKGIPPPGSACTRRLARCRSPFCWITSPGGPHPRIRLVPTRCALEPGKARGWAASPRRHRDRQPPCAHKRAFDQSQTGRRPCASSEASVRAVCPPPAASLLLGVSLAPSPRVDHLGRRSVDQ